MKPETSNTQQPTSNAQESRAWMTTREAGAELGFGDATVIKMAVELGGYRSSKRGPYRFSRKRVLAYKGREAELRKPNATVQALAKELSDLVKLGIERENRCSFAMQKLEQRIAVLEKRSATAGHLERIAA